jgi:radical SAM-linked protein
VWVSHKDLLQAFERAARVAELPLDWSQGFNPRPRIAVPLALAVGMVGRSEVVEVELSAAVPAEALRTRWQAALPDGLGLLSAKAQPAGTKAGVAVRAHYRVTWGSPPAGLQAAADGLLLARSAVVVRETPKKTREIDVRRFLEGCRVEGAALVLAVRVEQGTARPDEVLRAMGMSDDVVAEAAIVREGLDLADEE